MTKTRDVEELDDDPMVTATSLLSYDLKRLHSTTLTSSLPVADRQPFKRIKQDARATKSNQAIDVEAC